MQPHEEDSQCKSDNYLWKLSSVGTCTRAGARCGRWRVVTSASGGIDLPPHRRPASDTPATDNCALDPELWRVFSGGVLSHCSENKTIRGLHPATNIGRFIAAGTVGTLLTGHRTDSVSGVLSVVSVCSLY